MHLFRGITKAHSLWIWEVKCKINMKREQAPGDWMVSCTSDIARGLEMTSLPSSLPFKEANKLTNTAGTWISLDRRPDMIRSAQKCNEVRHNDDVDVNGYGRDFAHHGVSLLCESVCTICLSRSYNSFSISWPLPPLFKLLSLARRFFDIASSTREAVLHHLHQVPDHKLRLDKVSTPELFIMPRRRAAQKIPDSFKRHMEICDISFAEIMSTCAGTALLIHEAGIFIHQLYMTLPFYSRTTRMGWTTRLSLERKPYHSGTSKTIGPFLLHSSLRTERKITGLFYIPQPKSSYAWS